LLNFFSVTLTKAIEGVFGFVDSLIENIKKALVFMGLLKDEKAEKNQTERFTAQKQFTNNLPDGVTAENVQYYTKDELSKLREQQNSGINNTTSNMVSSSSTASRQSTSNINIDKIDISTQATSTDQISREISSSLTNQLKKTTATYEDGIEA
jgi:type II secretory pathway component PulL